MRCRVLIGVLAVLFIVSGSQASQNVAVNISNNAFLMEDLNSVGLDLPAGEFEASVQFSGDFGGYHSKTVVCISSRDVFVLSEDEPYYFNNEDFSHIYGMLDFYAIIFDWSSLNDNKGTATVTLKQIITGDKYTVDVINGINVVQVERDLNPVGIALDAGQYNVSFSIKNKRPFIISL